MAAMSAPCNEPAETKTFNFPLSKMNAHYPENPREVPFTEYLRPLRGNPPGLNGHHRSSCQEVSRGDRPARAHPDGRVHRPAGRVSVLATTRSLPTTE